MSTPDRSAAGPAAGYHFQIQRSLVLLLAASEGSEVSIETLDDVVIEEPSGGAQHHQLKHSIRPGTLTDASPPFWKALEAWMELATKPETDDVIFRLVTTHAAAEGTAAAALRRGGARDLAAAERLLLEVAATAEDPPPADASSLQKARVRFKHQPADRRRALLARIYVHDGDGDIADLREKLSEQLGPGALPRVGVELFLNQIMGWWEQLAAAMLMGTRQTVSRDEAWDHIRGVRDTFSAGRLPDLDRDLADGLTKSAVAAYENAPFVRQLELLILIDERVQQAISDYHRAYVQRSRWVKHAILTGAELDAWEDALVDEWKHAFLRMVDELPADLSPGGRTDAGKRFFGQMEASSGVPLRDGRHPVLRRGTLHGLANIWRVGWHPDFERLLDSTLRRAAGVSKSAAFDKIAGESP